jgi:RNA polymerase sigma factor (sigma-70 family)
MSSGDSIPDHDPQALLERWQQQGDEDALDALLRGEIEALAQRLRGRARGMMGASVSASDLAQEAVFRMLRLEEPPEFASQHELRAYLWRAAWHLLLNRLRSRRKAVELSDAQSRAMDDPALQTSGGFSTIERGERAVALSVVLNLLKPEDRDLLELIYFRQLPIEQVASTLGVARSAVDMRLSRARRRLAEKMLSWSQIVG